MLVLKENLGSLVLLDLTEQMAYPVLLELLVLLGLLEPLDNRLSRSRSRSRSTQSHSHALSRHLMLSPPV
jgi:hypothetical protein